MRTTAVAALRWVAVAVGFVALSACGGKHHINQYSFSGKTLALAYVERPGPELLHGNHDLDANDNAFQALVKVGAGVAKEVVARRARSRFDSATKRIDVDSLLAVRTLERASRYLGTRVAESVEEADFVLELEVRSFGVDARSNNATYLFSRTEAVLLDRRTGREIWNTDVKATDRLTPSFDGDRNVPSAIVTAATLHSVTVRDFVEALEQLTTLTSNVITNELREKLRDARDR
jgi:ABC-type uncharacterized transport system auxiliary subunit